MAIFCFNQHSRLDWYIFRVKKYTSPNDSFFKTMNFFIYYDLRPIIKRVLDLHHLTYHISHAWDCLITIPIVVTQDINHQGNYITFTYIVSMLIITFTTFEIQHGAMKHDSKQKLNHQSMKGMNYTCMSPWAWAPMPKDKKLSDTNFYLLWLRGPACILYRRRDETEMYVFFKVYSPG